MTGSSRVELRRSLCVAAWRVDADPQKSVRFGGWVVTHDALGSRIRIRPRGLAVGKCLRVCVR